MAQTPRIVFSPLSKRWYAVTRYRLKGGINTATGEDCSYIIATTKHDVTDQMDAILKAVAKDGRGKKRGSKPKVRRAGADATRTVA